MLVHEFLALALNKTLHVNDTDYEYTVDDIAYPEDKSDYDCDRGRAMIPASAISLDNPLPYNSAQNDPVLSGGTSQNLCLKNSPDKLQSCPSQACLLTGKKEESGDMEACCSWDLAVWLYLDPTFEEGAITIPAAFVTLEQGNQLRQDMYRQNSPVRIVLYSRPQPDRIWSSMLIWMLGVTVATLASYYSADDYRYLIRKTIRRQERAAGGGGGDRDRESRGRESQQNRLLLWKKRWNFDTRWALSLSPRRVSTCFTSRSTKSSRSCSFGCSNAVVKFSTH
jgi:hypothetical protein